MQKPDLESLFQQSCKLYTCSFNKKRIRHMYFLWILRYFSEQSFYRTSRGDYFWILKTIFNNVRLTLIKTTTSETWPRTLKKLEPKKTRTQENLGPEKAGSWKSWTQKNPDPEKPGPWKKWNKYGIKKISYFRELHFIKTMHNVIWINSFTNRYLHFSG